MKNNIEYSNNAIKSLSTILSDTPLKTTQLPTEMVRATRTLETAIEGLQYFVSRELYRFDASVTEDCCQVRAKFYSDWANETGIDDELTAAIKKIEQAVLLIDEKRQSFVPNSKNGRISVSDWLTDAGIDVDVPARIHAIILGYFLTITKLYSNNYRVGYQTNPNPILAMGYTKSAVTNLIKRWRIDLANFSVSYVQTTAQGLPDIESSTRLMAQVSQEYIKTDRYHVPRPPCFAMSDILWQSIKLGSTPVVLKVLRHDKTTEELVDTVATFFHPVDGNMIEIAPAQLTPSSAAIVLDGYCFKKRMPSAPDHRKLLNLEDLYYGLMATHPQYGNIKGEEPEPNALREIYKAIALRDGYCRENRKRCVLFHIYADTIGNQVLLQTDPTTYYKGK